MIKKICQGFFALGIDSIYPKTCPVCGEIIKQKQLLCCEECKNKFEVVKEPKCKKCGKPLEKKEQEYCFDCERKKFDFIKGYALWIYEDLCKNSLLRFKFQGKKEYVKFYSQSLITEYKNEISRLNIEAFVPIPIHNKKKKYRGYNQAELLSNELGKKCDISVISDVLYRKKYTKPQKELTKSQRAENLFNAFEVDKERLKKNILDKNINNVMLVDDIYTTGSTIQTCAKKLKESGIINIYFICVCIGRGTMM